MLSFTFHWGSDVKHFGHESYVKHPALDSRKYTLGLRGPGLDPSRHLENSYLNLVNVTEGNLTFKGSLFTTQRVSLNPIGLIIKRFIISESVVFGRFNEKTIAYVGGLAKFCKVETNINRVERLPMVKGGGGASDINATVMMATSKHQREGGTSWSRIN